MARWLILVGSIIVAIGLILHFAPSLLNWFGRLPGDLRIEGERGRFYFPITSMLLVSAILTVVIHLLRR